MKKKYLIIIVAVVAFFGAKIAVQNIMKKNLRKELAESMIKLDIDKEIAEMADEVNSSLPMMVDEITRLDNVEPGESKSFSYNYTLIYSEYSQMLIDQIQENLKSVVKENVRSSEEMRVFFENGVTVNYSYYDKNGQFLTNFSITPEEAKL